MERLPSLLLRAAAVFILLVGVAYIPVFGQIFDERMDDWPMDLTLHGQVMVHGGGELPPSAKMHWIGAALRAKAGPLQPNMGRLQSKPDPVNLCGFDDEAVERLKAQFAKELQIGFVRLIEVEELNDALPGSSGLWLDATGPLSEAERQKILKFSAGLRGMVAKRGCLVVSDTLAGLLGEQVLVDDSTPVSPGMNLLPDSVLVTGEQDREKLLSVLEAHPRSVGIQLERATMLIVAGRKVWVEGKGSATLMLAANERKPLRTRTIRQRASDRTYPDKWMLDLSAWRRDAIDRTLEPFPALEPKVPDVDKGTLVMVGGGGMPKGLMAELVEMAGGEKAHMVYVPCSESETPPSSSRMLREWEKMGVASATMVHTKDREAANSDEAILAPLRRATGLWFGGGRQWNFSDSYYGTEAHRLMKEVLTKRGGAIGGSSAGASIQGRYLTRATPIGNLKIMAPGYERGGLGFLSGVAIDQHFSQRKRQADLKSLVETYPQLLGIGIDEATAIIVRGSEAKVVGRGSVFFYDHRSDPAAPLKPVMLGDGGRYDLAGRKVVGDGE